MVEIVGLVLDRQVRLYGGRLGGGKEGKGWCVCVWGGGGGVEKVENQQLAVFLQFCRGGDCRFGFGQTSPLIREPEGEGPGGVEGGGG